ncbi:ABC-2 type transport system permease protein [Paenibacillus cellulosilyticus]|uniref:ABC-2 type transport system permease protein n=1 Tax=Paenibacillus cellulosilyticus TaxID=375489 RepID=A0A2V2YM30_9BACL|nr:ABC transporter permease subunit [Paenibacillus cellulosilyticus]PWV94538.1 ABC-2 type transport system permease protein [Paenibacillus cellulosilyticus]QKS45042.1 ABC transporter permease subunit [Paenibacillus cellulosilyticus]
MIGFMPMLSKELRELGSSLKILYIPIVFTLLTIMQPVTLKMLPTLLKDASNLPEGTIIQIPDPSVIDVMGSLLPKFGSLGSIIIILIIMGEIAGERASGVMAMVFAKPISYVGYFAAKLIAGSLLVIVSLFAGMIISSYYTEIMFDKVDWLDAMLGTLLYVPYILMTVAITLCCSAFMKSQVGAGGVAFVLYLVLTMVPQYLGSFFRKVSPSHLVDTASNVIMGVADTHIVAPLVGTLVLCSVFIAAGMLLLRRQEV